MQQGAQGDVVTADANLKTAKINLGYTEITAPIGGIVGKTNVTKGNVVGPDSGVLTTIVSQDPMYVTFPVSQREFLNVQARASSQSGDRKVGVRSASPTAAPMTSRRVINFVDVTVDRATDTVLVRATIPNPNGALIDGQLVRVSVQGDKPEEKVLVPQSALIVDQQGTYVFVVAGRQGGSPARQARRREGRRCGHRRRPDGRRAGGRAGHGEPAPGRRGDRDAGAAAAQPELIRCSPAIFVDRPRLATVIAIVTTIAGLLSLLVIPIAQYPGHRAAAGLGHHDLSGRFRRGGRGDGRAADREPGRRRRQDDLHEERQRQ